MSSVSFYLYKSRLMKEHFMYITPAAFWWFYSDTKTCRHDTFLKQRDWDRVEMVFERSCGVILKYISKMYESLSHLMSFHSISSGQDTWPILQEVKPLDCSAVFSFHVYVLSSRYKTKERKHWLWLVGYRLRYRLFYACSILKVDDN